MLHEKLISMIFSTLYLFEGPHNATERIRIETKTGKEQIF
jgi:hypothetical protein